MAKQKKKHTHKTPDTIGHLIIASTMIIALLVTDVFFVTVKKIHLASHTDLTAYADANNTFKQTIYAMRGNIFDRSGRVLAEDSHTYDIYLVLDKEQAEKYGESYVENKEQTATVLSSILPIDKQTILDTLQQDVYQVELGSAGRNLTKDVKEKIEAQNLPGVKFTDSITRIYPKGDFASHLIGYVTRNEDGSVSGKMGLEQVLNSYLAGVDGYTYYQADSEGYVLPGMKETTVSGTNGNDVYLTIDSSIQEQLESSFLQTKANYPSTTKVWGAVMDANTGKVLAWGQNPGFDPNQMNISEYNDLGRQIAYEPGSTMKTFTWAATINEGKYNSENTAEGYEYCYAANSQNNPVRVASKSEADGCVYNFGNYSYDNPTLDEGLMKSLNTVAVTLENEYITPDILKEYLDKFGFFQNVDTDGLSDDAGILNFSTAGDKINLSFGQGSTVTMLQMLQAYSAIVTDGSVKKPYFIDSIRDAYDSSKIYYQGKTTILNQAISKESAAKTREVLWKVANEEGGGLLTYRIPECQILGKTGTAEVSVNGSYDSGTVISSIAIGMPANNPKVVVYYAFEHSQSEPANHQAEISLMRKVAQVLNLSDTEDTTAQSTTSDTAEQTPTQITTTAMPSLINHSVSYAQAKLQNSNVEVIVLGANASVIDQYPRVNETIETGQRVFLLTDTQSFTMVDMTGWTRKDVSALWAVSGFAFKLSGTGKVVSQSIPPGTVVSKGTQIEVTFG